MDLSVNYIIGSYGIVHRGASRRRALRAHDRVLTRYALRTGFLKIGSGVYALSGFQTSVICGNTYVSSATTLRKLHVEAVINNRCK